MAFKPRIVKTPTTDSIIFIHYLEQNKYFVNKVKEIRLRLHLPKKGLPLKFFYKANIIKDKNNYPLIRGLTREENNIFYTYSEHDGWQHVDPLHHNQQLMQQKFIDLWKRKSTVINHFFETYIPRSKKKLGMVEDWEEMKEAYEYRKGSGFGFFKLRHKMQNDITEMLKKLRLPDVYRENLFMAITFNAIYDIRTGNTGDFDFGVGKDHIIEIASSYSMPILAIFLPYQFTIEDIVRYLKVNRQTINDLQKKYLVEKLPRRNAHNLKIVQELYELRVNKKKSHQVAIKLLLKKYERDQALCDWLNSPDLTVPAFNRYKKDLENFPTKNTWIWKILNIPPEVQ